MCWVASSFFIDSLMYGVQITDAYVKTGNIRLLYKTIKEDEFEKDLVLRSMNPKRLRALELIISM